MVDTASPGNELTATADAITASGGQAACRRTDVTRPGDLRALVDLAAERFGRLDVPVQPGLTVDPMPLSLMQRVIPMARYRVSERLGKVLPMS